VCWDHWVSNSEVRRRVLGNDGKLVDEVVNLHRLRWLGHLLRMPEHRLPRRAVVHSVLLYDCETWPLRVEDIRKLLVLDHRCFTNIARICWDYRVSSSEIRRSVLENDGKSVDEFVHLHRLRWLGHVLRMPEHRLPRRAMLASVGDSWKKVRGGQTKTCHQCLKSLTSGLNHVGRCRLFGWGPP
ncbi:unnamed protein product, partial [Schistosoma mattheei]